MAEVLAIPPAMRLRALLVLLEVERDRRRAPEITGGETVSRWQQGAVGQPRGRPLGSKHKLGESFLEALLADWQEHGAATIARVREEKPDQYLKVIASALPRDLNVHASPFDDWSDEELLAGIRRVEGEIRMALVADQEDEAAWPVVN
ncbi:MAG: hypothetical protein IPK28_15035 [Devosia sp.]|nr:hypothetical protein [Devosia sp.]